MSRTIVFVLVFGAFFLTSTMSGGSVSSVCSNADCLVSASSSPFSVALAVGLLLFLVFYPQLENTADNTRVVGVWRRFGAFFLDFTLVLMSVTPLAALPFLWAEAGHTGIFQWSFEREFLRPTDSVYILPSVFAAFLALFYYFYQHARVGRQTIGQYVLGYRVVRASGIDGEPKYGMRVVMSFLGLCIWPISVILALRNSHKAFWWDAATGSNVARVASANNRIERTRDR